MAGRAEDRFGILGKVVARTYEVEEVVAEGGFGVVYRAHHKGFRAKVALKCLKIPTELDEEQRRKFLEQFRSEAEVMFRLSSQIPSIVRPLHVDAFHGEGNRLVPFMALEWLEGRTLDALVLRRAETGRPPLGFDALARLLLPVAQGLEQAHNLEGEDGTLTVIHRDMKPENLFVARQGGQDVAKILDFGISKVKSAAGQLAGRASQTGEAFVAFSPAFAAPEQWAPRSYGQTGRWTDVWGFAITLVEAAKGSDVVSGDHAEMLGTIIDPVRRPTPRNEGIRANDATEAVFQKALAVDPRQRYATVAEFWDDFVGALGLGAELGGLSQRSANRLERSQPRTSFESVFPPAASAPASPPVPARVGSDLALTQVAAPPAPAPRPSFGSIALAERAPSPVRRPPVAMAAPRPRPGPSLGKALGPALSLLSLSVALTLLDRAFATSRGVPLAFGPVRASWVAAAILIAAFVNGIGAVRRALR